MKPTLLRRIGAELIGTYALITAGCGAIMVNAQTGALGHLGIALTFGLVVVAMIASVGHISGSHLNPAVTIAFALTRHFPRREVVGYIAGQFIGAALGAITLRLLIGDAAYLGATFLGGTVTVGQAFGLEVLLTAVLMFVVISVATDTRAVGTPAAIAIGFTVTFNALWGGPVSGASMNPVRSFAPALVAGVWTDQWIYWTAPIIGACIGAVLYQWIRGEKE